MNDYIFRGFRVLEMAEGKYSYCGYFSTEPLPLFGEHPKQQLLLLEF